MCPPLQKHLVHKAVYKRIHRQKIQTKEAARQKTKTIILETIHPDPAIKKIAVGIILAATALKIQIAETVIPAVPMELAVQL